MPAPPAREFLRTLIEKLASEWNASVFPPHVTLHVAAELDHQQALDCLRALKSRPVELEVDSIRSSDVFTKTLYVQFRPASAATELSAVIREQLRAGGNYEFDPHLSLIYKNLPAADKEKIAESVALPFASVTFDAVRVITGRPHTNTAGDVNAWRTLGEQQLMALQ